MKLGAKLKYKDNKKYIEEGLEKMVALVQKQLDRGKITGVFEFNSMVHHKAYEIRDNWIYQSRVVSKYVKKFQVFFKVQTSFVVLELVKGQFEYCKQYNITVTNKLTKN